MKNLEYTDIFQKVHTHKQVLKKNIVDGLTHIVMEEKNVSEKSFSKIDEIVSEVKLKISK